MGEKYVKLKHVQELIKLINIRDGYEFWMSDDKCDKKVNNTIRWLERNAKEFKG